MKLRITKGRIACAIVLAPVLYVLNSGPVLYCCRHFGLDTRVFFTLYLPVLNIVDDTPLGDPYIFND